MTRHDCKVKAKKSRALNETPSQSYGMSLAIWDHTVLPTT